MAVFRVVLPAPAELLEEELGEPDELHALAAKVRTARSPIAVLASLGVLSALILSPLYLGAGGA
jgi:hypothetical protein